MGATHDGIPRGRIGIGRTAEVYAAGDDTIVKILRPGFPDSVGEREAAVATIVTELGLAAVSGGGSRRPGRLRIDGSALSTTGCSTVGACRSLRHGLPRGSIPNAHRS